MHIGHVIRKYRKERNLTQEEMAYRLGVTTPAVNKWEKGNSSPDIMMLAPIARLLNISLDTLLSFHEELTDEEIAGIVREADKRLKQESYDEAFQWIKKQIETYPNCKMLIWQLAAVLDAQRLIQNVPDAEKYDNYILKCYEQVLESKDENLRVHAAESLFGYYLRKEQYAQAEEYLTYYSEQNPERKRMQALIFGKTDRREEAYKAYEELLFSEYSRLSMIFNSIYILTMQDKNMDKAHRLVEKQQELAKIFEMGAYHEVSCKLELATVEKDVDAVVEIMKNMLDSVDEITAFTESELYEHMTFKNADTGFVQELKSNLVKCFQDEETYGFMREDGRYLELVLQDR